MLWTMIFNILAPLFELMIGFLYRTLSMAIDGGICRKVPKTRQTTLQGYIDLYAGPHYQIHYKYSAILNVIFVTMTFGVGIPILFPCALLFLIGIYFMEKLTLYYYYRQPPLYDEKLNERVLKILTFSPLLLLTFGYWFLSNKQLLSNDYLKPTKSKAVEHDPQHYLWEVFSFNFQVSTWSPASPLLILTWICAIYYLTKKLGSKNLLKKMKSKCPCLKVGEKDREEVTKIDDYWRCLDDDDREWTIMEERNSREHLNIATMYETAMLGL